MGSVCHSKVYTCHSPSELKNIRLLFHVRTVVHRNPVRKPGVVEIVADVQFYVYFLVEVGKFVSFKVGALPYIYVQKAVQAPKRGTIFILTSYLPGP